MPRHYTKPVTCLEDKDASYYCLNFICHCEQLALEDMESISLFKSLSENLFDRQHEKQRCDACLSKIT